MKKYISCLLVLLALLLPGLAVEAGAAEIIDSGTYGENVTWTLDDEGTLIISGTGAMEDNGGDGMPWYSQKNRVKSVVIEDGVTKICDYAFDSCSSLTSVTIPASITEIGCHAFGSCSSLTSVTIPASITEIGEDAFVDCTVLSDVYITDLAAWTNIRFANEFANPTLAEYGREQKLYLNGEPITRLMIPEGVTRIGDYSFYGCNMLTSITIPEGVTEIGEFAFAYCSAVSRVTIPEGVTAIGGGAFSDCSNLESVTIPDSVSEIGNYVFAGCERLKLVTIPAGITEIPDTTFSGCAGLTDIVIPEGVTAVGWYAFNNCYRLATVHYGGTEEQKAGIRVDSGNDSLWYTTWHYRCNGENCPSADSPFADIYTADYYCNPVLWAVEKGITNGLSVDTFGPDSTCTRGQIVTFLWRSCGSPEPKNKANPFCDVAESDYFYHAVLWAVENGITSGMSADSFAPNAPCTRGQVATFLWRAAGKPGVSGSNSFTDLTPGAYYYDAVLWAVANGVTNGMGEGIFAPEALCTRGQIVTFLYRAMV